MTESRLVWQPKDGALVRRPDSLAVEEPLEIRLSAPEVPAGVVRESAGPRRLSVTMRTPGHDFELAAGWLLGEGVIDSPADLHGIRYCTDPGLDGEQRYNVVTADLKAARRVAERLTMTSSSCGVCGSASIEELKALGHPSLVAGEGDTGVVSWEKLLAVPGLLAAEQGQFRSTGGLHAAGLITVAGEVLAVREDIGRHNAVDKVVGWAVLQGRYPLVGTMLAVSGRTSFEIVQKAMRAGISFVAGISAASSLAARMAEESGMTLVGFLRGERCTVYAHPERIAMGGPGGAPPGPCAPDVWSKTPVGPNQ